MSLHDTEGLTIETSTAAESLPDPTTVGGRTHVLANTGLLTVVWSSTGATPFTEDGVNVVTISVPTGAAKRVQSNGTRWAVIGSTSTPDFFRSGPGVGGSVLPDGTTDTTDSIVHNGKLALGALDPTLTHTQFQTTGGIAHGSLTGVVPNAVLGSSTILGDIFAVQVNAVAGFVRLPDPTTVPGRLYHIFRSSGAVTTTFTVDNVTSFFQVPGVPGTTSASYAVTGTGYVIFTSINGSWVADDPTLTPTSRHTYAASGTTDAAGNVTFTFPTAFAAVPKVTAALQFAASASPIDYRITALSTTAVTINVRQSLATVIALLGLTLLAASLPLAGATIHIIATDAGETF